MTLIKKADPFEYDRADSDAWLDFMNDQHRSVKDPAYGALGDDTGNDAIAINAAINDTPAGRGGIVYMPPGIYRCTSAIVFPTDRQVSLLGAGPEATRIHVPSGTTATPGVIHLRGNEWRQSVEQMQIAFDQPDTVTRTAMTNYVPAIYAQAVSRFRLSHLRIVRAWEGIDMRGNCGGAEIDHLEMSHFNCGIHIDGSLDSVRFSHIHDWVFGCSGDQSEALLEEVNVGVKVGRVDGLHITDSLFLCGTGLHTFASVVTTGIPTVSLTGCNFDTGSGIRYQAGLVRVGQTGFGTVTASGYQAIHATVPSVLGHLHLTNCFFLSDAGTAPLVEVVGAGGGMALQMNIASCNFYTGAGDQSAVRADATAGGVLQLTLANNHFGRVSNVAYATPTIYLGANVRSTVTGNITLDKGSGAGTFVSVAADGFHTIADNNFLSWTLALPATHTGISAYHNVGALGGIQYARGGEGQMGCRVYRVGGQAILNSTVTPIGFDTERFDTPGWHSTVTNISRVTVPVAGWYEMHGTIEWAGGNNVGSRFAHIRLNGTTDLAVQGGPVSGSVDIVINNVATAYYLAAGDYVELCASHSAGTTLNVTTTPNRSPELSVARISP